jgi:hypothetical protein
MNEQFFYVRFRLRLKPTGTQPVTQDPEVILEFRRRLVEDWNWENPSDLNSDEAIFSPAEAGV